MGNNPINANDPTGKVAQVPVGAAIGFVSSLGTELILNGGNFSEVNWWAVAGGTTAGAFTGGLSAFSTSFVQSTGVSAAISLSGATAAGVGGNVISRLGNGLSALDPIQTPVAAGLGFLGGSMGLLTAAVAAPAVEAGALSPFAADVLGGVVAFEVSLPFEIGASQLLPSADVSSGCGFCPAGGDLGPGPWSPSASGGFVLYPSKVNLNMATRVYSK